MLVAPLASAQMTWYVTSTGPFGTPPSGGSSWSNPTSLDNALALAANGDEILVKEGFYVPAPASPDPREASYTVKRGISLRGGFLGHETTNKPLGSPLNTHLSGEIGPLSSNDDNLYHVVRVNVPTGAKVSISGFQIERGKASDTSGMPFPPGDSRGRGAGLHIFPGSVVVLSNLFINENSSTGQGAGIYCGRSSVTMRQMTFYNNVVYTLGSRGGGLFSNQCDLRLANVVFDTNGNQTSWGGGAYLKDGTTQMANCVFYANRALYPGGTGGALSVEGSNVSTLWNCTLVDNQSLVSPASAYTIDTTQITTGSFRLNNCIVYNPSMPLGTAHFQLGPATTASSCLLQPIGTLPLPPAFGYLNNTTATPVFASPPPAPNLSLNPNLNPTLVGLEALPADFADVDEDLNGVEALPWDRERQLRIPASGILQMGAYAAAYATLQVP